MDVSFSTQHSYGNQIKSILHLNLLSPKSFLKTLFRTDITGKNDPQPSNSFLNSQYFHKFHLQMPTTNLRSRKPRFGLEKPKWEAWFVQGYKAKILNATLPAKETAT